MMTELILVEGVSDVELISYSIPKIGRTINCLFDDVSFRAGEWESNDIFDSFGQQKKIDTYLLIVPADKKGALESVVIDALKDMHAEKPLIEEVILFIDSLKEGLAPELRQVNRANKATVGTFFSVRNPQNAMRSFGAFISEIDWSNSNSLKELFLPFSCLGKEKEVLKGKKENRNSIQKV